MARLTVLCGTGMTELATSTDGAEVETFRSDTPWGEVPCTLVHTGGHEILFIYRHHSPDGKVNPPHRLSTVQMCMLQPRLVRMQSSAYGV